MQQQRAGLQFGMQPGLQHLQPAHQPQAKLGGRRVVQMQLQDGAERRGEGRLHLFAGEDVLRAAGERRQPQHQQDQELRRPVGPRPARSFGGTPCIR